MLQRTHPYAKDMRDLVKAAGAGLLALGVSFGLPGSAAAGPKAVVELFTSQGCSSCPPADLLFGQLSHDKDLVVLSLPVDYWDYLGWRDTLASSENSARQRAYAEKRGDRAVYTPQAVINGKRHVIGSDKRAITIAVDTSGGLPVDVDAHLTRDSLTIDVGSGVPPGMMGTVWLVLFDREREVTIKRGENRGRKIAYHNVVRRMQAIGMWKGKPATFELPRSEIVKAGSRGCAVLVQGEDATGRPGPIVGATYLGHDLQKSASTQ